MRGDLDEILDKLKGDMTREKQKQSAVRAFEKSDVFMMACKAESGFELICKGKTEDLMMMLAMLVSFMKADHIPDLIIQATVEAGLHSKFGT